MAHPSMLGCRVSEVVLCSFHSGYLGSWIAPCHLFVWTCFREVTAVARHPATPADANSQAIPTSPASPVSPTRPANPASTTGSYAHLLAQGTPPWCVSLLSAWPSECQAYLAATLSKRAICPKRVRGIISFGTIF